MRGTVVSMLRQVTLSGVIAQNVTVYNMVRLISWFDRSQLGCSLGSCRALGRRHLLKIGARLPHRLVAMVNIA